MPEPAYLCTCWGSGCRQNAHDLEVLNEIPGAHLTYLGAHDRCLEATQRGETRALSPAQQSDRALHTRRTHSDFLARTG